MAQASTFGEDNHGVGLADSVVASVPDRDEPPDRKLRRELPGPGGEALAHLGAVDPVEADANGVRLWRTMIVLPSEMPTTLPEKSVTWCKVTARANTVRWTSIPMRSHHLESGGMVEDGR